MHSKDGLIFPGGNEGFARCYGLDTDLWVELNQRYLQLSHGRRAVLVCIGTSTSSREDGRNKHKALSEYGASPVPGKLKNLDN